MDKISKENVELSASGESSESTELKTTQINSETNGDLKADEDLVMFLRDQLTQLSQRSPEQTDQELSRLLLLFIQVQKISERKEAELIFISWQSKVLDTPIQIIHKNNLNSFNMYSCMRERDFKV